MEQIPLHPIEDPLAEDFRLFVREVWEHLGLPEPTRIQYDIAYYLQHGPKRRMIQAFRGIGKTWITTAYAAWRLYIDPQLKILIVSAGGTHADNTAIFLRMLIDSMPILEFLKPGPETKRTAMVEFDVRPATAAQSASVTSIGITGQMTGKRADLIIGDDIETPNNSETQMMREKIASKTEEFASLLTPKDESEVVYLGTPQVEQSLYNKLPERGYDIRIWPARYPDKKLLEYFGNHLAPSLRADLLKDTSLEGKPTEPKRFSESILFKKEAEMGRSTFQLQMMLNTSMSDAEKYPLKLADLVFLSLNPEVGPQKVVWASSPDLIINDKPNVGMNGDRMYRPMQVQGGDWLPFTGAVLAIDPSGRGKDETGYAVVKILFGQLFLLDVGGFSAGYSNETLEGLANIAKKYKVNQVIYEKNFGDGMFGALLRPVLHNIYPCSIEEITSKGQKEKRVIDILEPVMNQHKLIIDMDLLDRDYKSVDQSDKGIANEVKPQYRFFHQLTRITKDKGCLLHDDRIEAVAMAVAYWTAQMGRDVDKAVEDQKQKLLIQELKAFSENVFGPGSAGKRNWCSY
jgi:hypothetical protein